MKKFAQCMVLGMIALSFTLVSRAELNGGSNSARPLLTEKINTNQRFALAGNTHAMRSATQDLGRVEDPLELKHLYLTLKRAPEQETALRSFLDRQQQKGAPEYHQWLTPQQYGERFGVASSDIEAVTAWLEQQGFHVNNVSHSGMFIDFSGTAGTVRTAFGTPLHYYTVGGKRRIANSQEPQLPLAFQPLVAGLTGLTNIRPTPQHTPIRRARFNSETHRFVGASDGNDAAPEYSYPGVTDGFYLGPEDFYTIYNTNPLFQTGTTGAGASIAVIEESDIEFGTVDSNTGLATGGDVANFRSLFGVNAISPTLNMHVYHGYGNDTCEAPGIDPEQQGEDVEASLDAEWATAVAPAANLIFMSCLSSNTTDGIFLSMQALVDNNLSDAMSLSYGFSELGLESSDFAYLDAIYEQAAAQGQSVSVSSGDSGSDVADDRADYATNGINVNAFSSGPYVTSAGGTDFSDAYDATQGGPAQTTYWNTGNTQYYGSALGYVPETAWNSNCAGSLLNVLFGTSGDILCGTGFAAGTGAGSGGLSTNYTAPPYQVGTPGFASTMRGQPDISFLASNGWWGHALLLCDSNPAYQNEFACSNPLNFGSSGGTSFVAPQIAGVAGLLVSYTGQRQGILNYGLYALAKNQFSSPATKSACYSNGQTANTGITTGLPASSCIFNDVTTGNNDVACAPGSLNCFFRPYTELGVLSTTKDSLSIAYNAGPQYDLATGLGSVNVANLITEWNTNFSSDTSLHISSTTVSYTGRTALTGVVTVSGPGGTPSDSIAGTITFYSNNKYFTQCQLSGSSPACTVLVSGSAFGGLGTYAVTATYSGNNNYPGSSSPVTDVIVTAADTTTDLSITPGTVSPGGSVTLQVSVSADGGVPVGTVKFNFEGSGIGSCALSNGQCSTSLRTQGIAAGTYEISASYLGSGGFAPSVSTAQTLTTRFSTSTTLTVSPTTVTPPGAMMLTATVKRTQGSGGPTGAVVSSWGGSGKPAGAVVFYWEGRVLGTANVDGSGVARLSRSSVGVPAGNYPVMAIYQGGPNDAGSSSPAVTVTVK